MRLSSLLASLPADVSPHEISSVSDDPIIRGITYDSRLDTAFHAKTGNPLSYPDKLLSEGLYVECSSCHNAHDNAWGDFLVMDNQNALLCRQCHNLTGFNTTPHALNPNQWTGIDPDPWPHTEYETVATNACLNCHYAHHAGGPEQLQSSSIEEDVCFVCHNGKTRPLMCEQ